MTQYWYGRLHEARRRMIVGGDEPQFWSLRPETETAIWAEVTADTMPFLRRDPGARPVLLQLPMRTGKADELVGKRGSRIPLAASRAEESRNSD